MMALLASPGFWIGVSIYCVLGALVLWRVRA